MATQAQIFSIRLLVRDPFGYNSIVEVASASALPATPIAQTLYYVADVKEYQAYESGTWVRQDLAVGDERIGTLYDLYGDANKTAAKVVGDLIIVYGREIGMLSKTANGTESQEYRTLKDILDFYKDLRDQFTESANETSGNDTGRYIHTRQPMVGGMRL
jgi:hypothetical protein